MKILSALLSFIIAGTTVKAQLATSYLCEQIRATGNASVFMDLYTYDATNHISNAVTRVWVDTAGWRNDYQYSYTNTPQGYPVATVSQTWIASASTWSNLGRWVTVLNSYQAPTSQYVFYWANNVWTITSKLSWQYDVTNNAITETVTDWSSALATYTNTKRSTRQLNAAGKDAQVTYETWDDTASVWKEREMTAYTYDAAGNLTNEAGFKWNGSGWEAATQHDYIYDANNRLEKDSIRNMVNGGWRNSYRFQYARDAAGNVLKIDQYNWNVTLNRFDHSYKYTYSYSPASIDERVRPEPTIHVFPIPASGVLNVKSEIDTNALITDIHGRHAMEIDISQGETQIDVSTLKPGIYILNTATGSLRFIVQ